jgi:hypothetical protein
MIARPIPTIEHDHCATLTLRATAPRLLLSWRSGGVIWMWIFAMCPLFGEPIILVPDHHFGSMSILLREIDGGRESLLLGWES